MRSEQEGNELRDKAIYNLRRSEEKFQDRLTLNNLRLHERYVEGELDIFVAFKVPLDTEHWIALLCAQKVAASRDRQPDELIGQSASIKSQMAREHLLKSPTADFYSDFTDGGNSSEQELMLVDIVQIVEGPEYLVPSLIRIGSADDICGLRVDSLYFSARLGFVLLQTWKDRESRLMLPLRLIPGGENQLMNEVVEGASQVVDRVSGDQGQFFRDRRTLLQKANSHVLFDIILWADRVSIGIEERGVFPCEIRDVLFGPFDF